MQAVESTVAALMSEEGFFVSFLRYYDRREGNQGISSMVLGRRNEDPSVTISLDISEDHLPDLPVENVDRRSSDITSTVECFAGFCDFASSVVSISILCLACCSTIVDIELAINTIGKAYTPSAKKKKVTSFVQVAHS